MSSNDTFEIIKKDAVMIWPAIMKKKIENLLAYR